MHPWLSPPRLGTEEETTQGALLYRLLRAMAVLACLGAVSSLFDARNDLRLTVVFYGAVLLWLGVVGITVRRGRVMLAAWFFGFFFWVLIALVTLVFGGMQGQNAATFTVCILLIGSVVGGRAALAMALLSSVWCAFVVYLEVNGKLPIPLGPYSPVNAWGAVTVTLLLTSVLLKESLESLRRTHSRAEKSAAERDEALRRSIQGQKMELVGNLTSGIAHDFNNLLTVISSSSQTLRGTLVLNDRENAAILDDLDDATARAALMTRQLLSFGRPRVGEPEPVNLTELVVAMGKMLPRLLGSKITVAVRSDPEAWVLASQAGLEQVLLNLAVNARDAMPEGGNFEVDLSVRGAFVFLRATDTGVGMSEELRSRIFEPFFTTKASGTGLGLATVRQQVEQFGGRISVESELGRGTTFIVEFPKQRARRKTGSRSLPPATFEGPPSGQRGRILLVEDDPLVRRAVTRFLVAEGYEVLAVGDGEEALSVIASVGEIVCVVTDLSMPRLDGEQLANELSRIHPELPLVLMSGNREPNSETLGNSTRTFLPKPLDHRLLLDAIVRVTSPGDDELSESS
jgi:signal transduction histidine kinase/CheY-like chemotaxis protein